LGSCWLALCASSTCSRALRFSVSSGGGGGGLPDRGRQREPQDSGLADLPVSPPPCESEPLRRWGNGSVRSPAGRWGRAYKKPKAESVRIRPLARFPLVRVREESLLLFGGGRRGSRVGSRGSCVSSGSRAVGRSRVSGLGFASSRRVGRGRLGGGFATTSSRENSERTERDQRTNRHMGILLLPNRKARTWNRRPSTSIRLTHKAQRRRSFQ